MHIPNENPSLATSKRSASPNITTNYRKNNSLEEIKKGKLMLLKPLADPSPPPAEKDDGIKKGYQSGAALLC
jgi:hypothetical protein